MSEYIPRLRAELVAAAAGQRRRAVVRPRRVALAVAAAAIGAALVLAIGSLRPATDETPAGPPHARTDAERLAIAMRARMADAGVPGTVKVDGGRIALPSGAGPLMARGRLTVSDWEARGRPVITNADIASARPSKDQMTGEPVVAVELTREGGDALRALTRRLAQRGRARGANQHLAIAVDGKVLSRPYIDYRMAPYGVGGDLQISDRFTPQEARNLAAILSTALP